MLTNRTFVTRAVVVAVVLAIGIGAYADDNKDNKHGAPVTKLFTPPLVPEGNSQLDCYIINVSQTPRTVFIEVLDRNGVVVADWSERLGPSFEAVAISPAVDRPRSCRFTVEGSSQHFRASGLVHVPEFGSISALAAQ